MPLGLTKVAFSCASLETLQRRVDKWAEAGEIRIPTRMRPKRAAECIGGHLHYIVKHRIVGRVEILRFDERRDGRIDIVCRAKLEVVAPIPRRAHQGWRYLEEAEAPTTGDGEGDGLAALPPRLYGKLASLMLV
ncbi:DUF1489 family protein [Sphingomonas sp. ASV193]|uniref:DUF1489 family protein n=1 Tax=Sphingomonas sp. ASV193 TaxID=3144405 RepID=UPI0032E8F9DE